MVRATLIHLYRQNVWSSHQVLNLVSSTNLIGPCFMPIIYASLPGALFHHPLSLNRDTTTHSHRPVPHSDKFISRQSQDKRQKPNRETSREKMTHIQAPLPQHPTIPVDELRPKYAILQSKRESCELQHWCISIMTMAVFFSSCALGKCSIDFIRI